MIKVKSKVHSLAKYAELFTKKNAFKNDSQNKNKILIANLFITN